MNMNMTMQQEPQPHQRQRQNMSHAMRHTMTSEIQRLEGKFDALGTSLNNQMGQLAVDMAQLKSSIMQRAEIEAADARRVSLETYTSDQRQVNERLTRLEASPTRLLAWVSGGVGCLGVLVSIVSVGMFLLEFVLTHYKP